MPGSTVGWKHDVLFRGILGLGNTKQAPSYWQMKVHEKPLYLLALLHLLPRNTGKKSLFLNKQCVLSIILRQEAVTDVLWSIYLPLCKNVLPFGSALCSSAGDNLSTAAQLCTEIWAQGMEEQRRCTQWKCNGKEIWIVLYDSTSSCELWYNLFWPSFV